MPKRRSLSLLVALCVAGCAVGPRYSGAPKIDASQESWTQAADTRAPDATWWEAVHDATLDELVSAALERNLDIQVAREQLLEARATAREVYGSRFPEIDAAGSATHNELSENGEFPLKKLPGFARRFNLFDAGFDASWEIDLWGHTSRGVEAARARAESAIEARSAVELQTVAEIVTTYVTLRGAQARLASVLADAEARRRIAQLVQERYTAGDASRLDLARAQQLADTAAGEVPGLEADVRAGAFSLALLTGRPPEALLQLAEKIEALPAAPPTVGVGLRSEVLRRRPDVRAAERDLAAATADVGVATADLFPRVSLIAAAGQQAQHGGDLGVSASTRLQIGPSLSWPIFTAGRMREQVHVYEARAGEAATRYEKAVLSALSDSETALNRYAAAGRERVARESAAQDAAVALELARQRYAAGEDDLPTLLDTESGWHEAEQVCIAARTAELGAWASLYKALGGGGPPLR